MRTSRIGVALLAAQASSCFLSRAVDEALDPWSRYEMPRSHVSLALPARPRFVDEALTGSPCGDLVRTSFAVRGSAGVYAGSFIPLTPACAGDLHRTGLLGLVTPPSDPDWEQLSTGPAPGAKLSEETDTTYRKRDAPETLRTVRRWMTRDGPLAVVAESPPGGRALAEHARFLRGVRID